MPPLPSGATATCMEGSIGHSLTQGDAYSPETCSPGESFPHWRCMEERLARKSGHYFRPAQNICVAGRILPLVCVLGRWSSHTTARRPSCQTTSQPEVAPLQSSPPESGTAISDWEAQ